MAEVVKTKELGTVERVKQYDDGVRQRPGNSLGMILKTDEF